MAITYEKTTPQEQTIKYREEQLNKISDTGEYKPKIKIINPNNKNETAYMNITQEELNKIRSVLLAKPKPRYSYSFYEGTYLLRDERSKYMRAFKTKEELLKTIEERYTKQNLNLE